MPDWAKDEPEADDGDEGDDEAPVVEGSVGESGAVGADGIVRTRRGWRKLLAPGSSTAERGSQ
ncbi:MAG: hypothetical protein H0X16_07315 [Chloroflexi bacterium]|nr:hypothetical protein [Chloroflexota bacterium]